MSHDLGPGGCPSQYMTLFHVHVSTWLITVQPTHDCLVSVHLNRWLALGDTKPWDDTRCHQAVWYDTNWHQACMRWHQVSPSCTWHQVTLSLAACTNYRFISFSVPGVNNVGILLPRSLAALMSLIPGERCWVQLSCCSLQMAAFTQSLNLDWTLCLSHEHESKMHD